MINNDSTAIDYYLSDIKHIPLLSKNDEFELATKAKMGDKKARERLINSNLRLVINIAKKYKSIGIIDFEDIVNDGNIGLIRAVDKFDPDLGFKLSTYATFWIKESITRGIANKSRAVRLPVNVIKEINKFLVIKKKLIAKLDREPSIKEISDKTKRSEAIVREFIGYCGNESSLNIPAYIDDTAVEIQDTLKSNDSDCLAIIQADQVKKAIWRSMENLDNTHKKVIAMRFGLLSSDEKSLEHIANDLDICKETVRTYQKSAMKLMRAYIDI